MKIVDYCAKRSARDQYSGNLWIKTDMGEYQICFEATNFCLHDGKFFDMDSVPITTSEEYKKISLKLSLNGSPVDCRIMQKIRDSLEEAVINL
jgi:hypothetical protein